MSMLQQFFKEGVSLIPKGIITHYKELDLSPQAFILLLYLIDHQVELQSEAYLQRVSVNLGLSENESYEFLSELLTKEYIQFEMIKDHHGKQMDIISLEPLYLFLESFYKKDEPESQDGLNESEQKSLIQLFEGEFGRSLTQLELMQIADWKQMDQFNDEVIILALQQAVLNQAISLKYIDRILLDWKKKNVRTVQEAKREIESFNQAKTERSRQANLGNQVPEFEPFKVPEFDWNRFKPE